MKVIGLKFSVYNEKRGVFMEEFEKLPEDFKSPM